MTELQLALDFARWRRRNALERFSRGGKSRDQTRLLANRGGRDQPVARDARRHAIEARRGVALAEYEPPGDIARVEPVRDLAHHLTRAQHEITARRKRPREHLEHAPRRVAIEVNEHVPAQHDIPTLAVCRSGRPGHQIVRREAHSPTESLCNLEAAIAAA